MNLELIKNPLKKEGASEGGGYTASSAFGIL
jgi:hypothetical protein